jgi:hypothetical protein
MSGLPVAVRGTVTPFGEWTASPGGHWSATRAPRCGDLTSGWRGVLEAELDPGACQVCGYDVGGWDGGDPLYAICQCCGVESGVDDYPVSSARSYLAEWVAAGMPWRDPAEKPESWDLRRQLEHAGMQDLVGWLDEGGDRALRASRGHRPRFVVTPHWERRSQH